MDVAELEGIARAELERAGFDGTGPVDAFDLAHALGVDVRWTTGAVAVRIGRRAYLPSSTRIVRVHGLLTHETAHILMDDHRVPQDEPTARYLGAALLVPRRALDRQLRSGWDLCRLMAAHPNASAELLARRVIDLREAGLAIYDGGRLHRRIGPIRTPLERELVDAALSTGEPARHDDLTGAWPVFDGAWRRVIVLAG